MIRKQVYLAETQNEKVKRLAARRRCTEAEVIRDALDRLPDPDGDFIERLRAAGLLFEVTGIEAMAPGKLKALEKELEAWHRTRGEPIGLSQAILDEREESPW